LTGDAKHLVLARPLDRQAAKADEAHSVRQPARLKCSRCNEMGYSPDRVDALVWALTELMIEGGERRLLIA
jgi:phage terminase large subunit-like protein